MSSETLTQQSHFVHPLAFELNGKFVYTLNDDAVAALEGRMPEDKESFYRAMRMSVTTMVHASQVAEMDHLYGYGLTKGASSLTMQSEHAPTDETYEQYVSKVTNEDTLGEGLVWLAEKALRTYHQAYRGKRYIVGHKSPFESGGTINNGRLATTERLDRVIGNLPHLLEVAGANIVEVQSFDRDAEDTNIRHRLWPIELSSAQTIAFYGSHQSTDYYTLRRRRPVYDIVMKMSDPDNEDQPLLLEAYKESFALVAPALFSTEFRGRFDRAFAAHSISEILGKGSAVADVCGDAFRTVIDTRNETTPAIVPTYTCLMTRFTSPYATNRRAA